VREEVKVRKAIDRNVVEAEEQIRREELDVNVDGHPAVEQPLDQENDRL
jgi:stress response protein YsnF